jgi:hypothetical protein
MALACPPTRELGAMNNEDDQGLEYKCRGEEATPTCLMPFVPLGCAGTKGYLLLSSGSDDVLSQCPKWEARPLAAMGASHFALHAFLHALPQNMACSARGMSE